ncbi:MAG: SRPBCC domain-containing protein [Roseivivax sp.]|nr:SRPBCC domain-containing protein [Roseivivax sp.]
MTMTTERLSPTSLRVTRRFAAPPALVWQAHTDPDLIRRWLFGPDGWVLTRCEHDARPGGKMFYRWEMEDGSGGFELTGEVLEVDPPHRMKHVEIMHLPDPTPPNTVVTRFIADGSGTLMDMVMTVDDAATMEAMIATGMTEGMEASYTRLDGLGLGS